MPILTMKMSPFQQLYSLYVQNKTKEMDIKIKIYDPNTALLLPVVPVAQWVI
jgi:hypothetical protein